MTATPQPRRDEAGADGGATPAPTPAAAPRAAPPRRRRADDATRARPLLDYLFGKDGEVSGRGASIAGNPVLIGAATVLVVIVAVFLSYNANQGLPFVPDLPAQGSRRRAPPTW